MYRIISLPNPCPIAEVLFQFGLSRDNRTQNLTIKILEPIYTVNIAFWKVTIVGDM